MGVAGRASAVVGLAVVVLVVALRLALDLAITPQDVFSLGGE